MSQPKVYAAQKQQERKAHGYLLGAQEGGRLHDARKAHVGGLGDLALGGHMLQQGGDLLAIQFKDLGMSRAGWVGWAITLHVSPGVPRRKAGGLVWVC